MSGEMCIVQRRRSPPGVRVDRAAAGGETGIHYGRGASMEQTDNTNAESTGSTDYRQLTLVSRPLFFSSTFRDMHAERDLLRNDAFLELNERLRPRRHELNVIDLRQGVETAGIEDEAERELAVLKVCLDEIERTRPFLIGLLGDRYGWVPPTERMEAAARAAGFQEAVAGRSVTELELLYGLLKNPEQRARSRLYFRALDYTGMPDAVRAAYDERFAARNGTEAEQRAAAERWERLQALKARLQEAYPDRVRTYPARWAAERGGVTGLRALRAMVVEDLWADLDAHTREYERQAPRSWQAADTRALEDFVVERTRHYVERPAVTDPAVAFALQPGEGTADAPWGLCLAGESGLGKSALFSRIYQQLKTRQDSGEVLLLANAAGIHVGSGQVDRLLRRWIHELAAYLDIEDPLAEEATEGSRLPGERSAEVERTLGVANEEPASRPTVAEELEQTFASLLGRAAQKTRVVLLLDALNQFERTTRARYLTWLPRPWPGNVRLLATAIPGVETGALGRPDRGQRVDVRTLSPIEREEAREIANKVFAKRYHRAPNRLALEVLLDKRTPDDRPAHGNPLWLELALQEINLLEADDYQRADREYAGLPGAERLQALLLSVAEALPASVQAIYGELLARAERTFGESFTRATLSLIALGRAGWRESDLQALVPGLAGEPWTDLTFAGVRRSLGHHLVQRGEAELWDCFHAQLRETLRLRYLGDEPERRRLHGRVAEHLQSLAEGDPLRMSETMVHLMGLGDQERAARYLGGFQAARWNTAAGKAELTGAVAAMASTFESGEEVSDRERLTEWTTGLLNVTNSSPKLSQPVANVFIFDLNDALAVTGALEAPRGRILEASRGALERLYAQNPNDAQAARDVSVSLNALGDFYVRRGERGDAGRALESYQRCHETLERLYAQNPNDAQVARDLAVSHLKLYQIAQQTGEEEMGMEHLQTCHRILRGMHQKGMFLDPPALQLLKQLDDALG